MKKKHVSIHSSNGRDQNFAIYGRPWPKATRIENKKRQADKDACEPELWEDDQEEEED